MKDTYKLALAEVYEILSYFPEDLHSKIPLKLLEFIEKERDVNYKVTIKFPLNVNDYSLEAVVLIGIIYEDYIKSNN